MITRKLMRWLFWIISLLLVLIILIYKSQSNLNTFTRQIGVKKEVKNKTFDEPPKFTRTDAVVLLTQRRSGSSVVGEIFNRRTDVSYFYEPLIPFGERPCESLHKERVRALEAVLKCDFEKLPDLYKQAFSVSNVNDIWAKCKKHNICFTGGGKYSQFLSRDSDVCASAPQNGEGRQSCPSPIDTKKLSKHCKQGLFRAAKVIYLCRLEWLVPLLNDPTVNVKVVHLVRDPRATVKSRVKDMENLGASRYEAIRICEQLGPNMIDDNATLRDLIPRDKYLRIRHEDFSMDPIKVTQEVYDFIGVNMNPTIRNFLIKTTKGDMSKKETSQSTNRNSVEVVSAWRKVLPMDHVKEIQKFCEKPLRTLGYKIFDNEEDLRDIENIKHF